MGNSKLAYVKNSWLAFSWKWCIIGSELQL